MLLIWSPDSSLAPAVVATREAFRRWRMRRWHQRNRARIALIACDTRELSEAGWKIRAEAILELRGKLRDLGLRDPE